MKITILGKNIEVTQGLREAVEEKIGKLEKYFNENTEVHVTLSVEKENQKIEVTIPVKGTVIRSEQSSSDMYVSIDLVEEIIERQLKKYKSKLIDKQERAASFKPEFIENDYEEDPRDFIENLSKSGAYMFSKNVIIKTKDKTYDTRIAGKIGDRIITLDNDSINISDIERIYEK